MELRHKDRITEEIAVKFVMDSDAEVMRAMGYEHDIDKDYQQDGEWVEVWKPIKKMGYARFNKED